MRGAATEVPDGLGELLVQQMESSVTDNPAWTPRVCSRSLVPIPHGVYYCSTICQLAMDGCGQICSLAPRQGGTPCTQDPRPRRVCMSLWKSHTMSPWKSHTNVEKEKKKEKVIFLVQKYYRDRLRSLNLCLQIPLLYHYTSFSF